MQFDLLLHHQPKDSDVTLLLFFSDWILSIDLNVWRVVTTLLVLLITVQFCGTCCGINQNPTCNCRMSVLRPTWLFLRVDQHSDPQA